MDEKEAHQTLAAGCIQLMSTSLKQNICDMETPGVLVTDIESSRVKKYLPARSSIRMPVLGPASAKEWCSTL